MLMIVFIYGNIHVGKKSELNVRLCLRFIDEVIWVISEWRVIVKSCIWICNANMDINITLAAYKIHTDKSNRYPAFSLLLCLLCATHLLLPSFKTPVFSPEKNRNNECVVVMILCISLRHDHLDHCSEEVKNNASGLHLTT